MDHMEMIPSSKRHIVNRVDENTEKMAVAESDGEDSKETGRLGALRHGLAVFDLFEMDRQTVTTIEIARYLNIHKSTASRITSNLVLSGFLVPATDGPGFRLSGKLTRLGAIAAAVQDLPTMAIKHAQALADDVGETCQVGVLDGQEAVTVVLANGSYSLRLHSWVGKRHEASTTAMGKALLAGLSDGSIDKLYPKKSLSQASELSPATLDELKTQLVVVRNQGFALENEDLEPGLRCIAAPIFDHDGNVAAAINIAAAASRLPMSNIDYYVSKVKSTAADISNALGAPTDSYSYEATA
jgi:DNA-binding IclR family transcriptional regulator